MSDCPRPIESASAGESIDCCPEIGQRSGRTISNEDFIRGPCESGLERVYAAADPDRIAVRYGDSIGREDR